MILGILVLGILLGIVFWIMSSGTKMEEEEKNAGEQGMVLDMVLKNRYQLLLKELNYLNGTGEVQADKLIEIAELLQKSTQRVGQTTLDRNVSSSNMNKALYQIKQIGTFTPAIKADDNYRMFASLIDENSGELQAAKVTFNDHVRGFNQMLNRIPTNIVGELLGKVPLESFQNIK